MKPQLTKKLEPPKQRTVDWNDSYYLTATYIPDKTGTFKINFHTEIINIEQLTMGIEALEAAEEGDRVTISLQSCGGNVDASGGFIHAMEKCKAPIHIIASGGIHSAGTHILLQADSFELSRNFNSLIHNGSAGSVGNLNEYFPKAEFDKKFLYDYYKEIYTGFLTPKEFEDMWNGLNIWLNAEQWLERSEMRNEYFKKETDKLIKAYEKANKPARKPRNKIKVTPTSMPLEEEQMIALVSGK